MGLLKCKIWQSSQSHPLPHFAQCHCQIPVIQKFCRFTIKREKTYEYNSNCDIDILELATCLFGGLSGHSLTRWSWISLTLTHHRLPNQCNAVNLKHSPSSLSLPTRHHHPQGSPRATTSLAVLLRICHCSKILTLSLKILTHPYFWKQKVPAHV